jgi:putative endonuclease
MFYTYVLKSLKDGNLYIGSSEYLEKRIKAHNSGKVRSTKGRRPLKLVYYESYATKTEARKRENFYKSGTGRRLLRAKFEKMEG